ncbi:SRD5A2 [Cervus elaphus hippelaphus]|uniref:SRD5A2 n=1 Tax=Cervus elaphus hippelaphus TaxID=46360 RepID=A0A212CXP5_CEREH|nr:SRD5A2 [Cervus elaphus hippelaphus]
MEDRRGAVRAAARSVECGAGGASGSAGLRAGRGLVEKRSRADAASALRGSERFSGVFLFILGMGINIHSDYILRQLRKPGEIIYRIPQGGLFTYVSGANFLGEIIEWIGYALASWSLPALAFAFFSLCFLGLRAFHHHRFYLKMFDDYPKSRRALIPFIF